MSNNEGQVMKKATATKPTRQRNKTTPPVTKHNLPLKQNANVVLHVRVPGWQVDLMRKNGIDVPATVRQLIDQAVQPLSNQ